jgi:hypothetical protein
MEPVNPQLRAHYWAQAHLMQAKAAAASDLGIRETYVTLAAQWERLAHQAELGVSRNIEIEPSQTLDGPQPAK